MHTGPQGVPKH
jgi:hypothetical protein